MNRSSFWLLCLLGFAAFNQGVGRPQSEEYPADGEGDYADEEDDYPVDDSPPPKISSTSINLLVDEGGVAFLPCDVEGNPDTFSRVWRKDQTGLFVGSIPQTKDPRINNLQNGSLEIRQIQASDSGSYGCMISVAGKPEEVQHTLQVRGPAKITSITPNEKSVIRETSSLTLVCLAEGYPTPSIKWFRNGHVLEDQDPSIHGARYTINNASIEDSGIYKCTATNGQQQPDERIVEIEVHYPPQIKIERAIVPTGEGYESELKCTVTGMKKPELKWYKNEDQKPIVPSQRIKLEREGHDHILRIVKTKQADFGDYVCEAKNTEGNAQAVITLTGKPSRPEPDTVVTEGESKNPLLTFKVESFAPIEDYELLYKKEEKDEWVSVKPSVVSSPEGRIFTVKHVLVGLEPGVYNAQLKAKNTYGWSEFSTKVTFPKEHEGDLTETGLLAVGSSASELRISLALMLSLLVAHFYC